MPHNLLWGRAKSIVTVSSPIFREHDHSEGAKLHEMEMFLQHRFNLSPLMDIDNDTYCRCYFSVSTRMNIYMSLFRGDVRWADPAHRPVMPGDTRKNCQSIIYERSDAPGTTSNFPDRPANGG
jgi:hypothetical protein